MNYDNKLPTAEFKGHDNVMEFVSEISVNVNIYIAFENCFTWCSHVYLGFIEQVNAGWECNHHQCKWTQTKIIALAFKSQ